MTRDLTITLADGRSLDVTDTGASTGAAVLFHNGTPGSRRLSPAWVDVAAERGVRLFGFSRAGYGGSTEKPDRTIADVAADAEAVADALGIETFAVWGHSGGGPHSLACAALLPDRVRACVSSAGVAPYDADGLDFLAGMGEDNHHEFGLALQGRGAVLPWMEAVAAELTAAGPGGFAETLRSLMSPTDLAAFTDELAADVHANMTEGLAHGCAGWADDDIAFTRPWGFGPASITCPVAIWQGGDDLFVPPSHARWLAAAIPHAILYFRPDHGHLSLITAGFGQILDALLAA